jgi:hypothetical protein
MDIIVPDVELAKENTVTSTGTKVEVDLLTGGNKDDPGPLNFPMPTHISDQPQILTLERLISSKLSRTSTAAFNRHRTMPMLSN